MFVLTARFEIDFLLPVSTGEIRALGKVMEDDGRRIRAVGELYDAEDRLVGRGVGYFARSKHPLSSVASYR